MAWKPLSRRFFTSFASRVWPRVCSPPRLRSPSFSRSLSQFAGQSDLYAGMLEQMALADSFHRRALLSPSFRTGKTAQTSLHGCACFTRSLSRQQRHIPVADQADTVPFRPPVIPSKLFLFRFPGRGPFPLPSTPPYAPLEAALPCSSSFQNSCVPSCTAEVFLILGFFWLPGARPGPRGGCQRCFYVGLQL
ncbi:hypothetical protein BOTBODRAFT_348481 [Botryobasidium botryosum FD-172 SS1]|uniref:Uncharacterized protein n=1 Tax=Botryobasidium botryosum (strain FD-172 SS1) TaxID=930990 RepID=A0A067MR49_BOTB1|nr:hypothetical protein BOTBODRAFT_348481 [Botryobasidium botryosum FD-172 SS1]